MFGSSYARLNGLLAIPTMPPLACEDLRNAEAVMGSVAVAQRGGCEFAEKAQFAQAAGATALIIVNTDDTPVVAGVSPGKDTNLTIPVFTVMRTHGQDLLQYTGPPFQPRHQAPACPPLLSLAFGVKPRAPEERRAEFPRGSLPEFTLPGVYLKPFRRPQIKVASAAEMVWQDLWPSLHAQVVLTRDYLYLFQGYSFVHGGFWRVGESAVTGPEHAYTEAAVQQSPSLWLLSQFFCEPAMISHLSTEEIAMINTTGDVLDAVDVQAEGEQEDQLRKNEASSSTVDDGYQQPSPPTPPAPALHLHCSTDVAEGHINDIRRWLLGATPAVAPSLNTESTASAYSLQPFFAFVGLLLGRFIANVIERLLVHLPAWSCFYAPAAFATSHLLRNIESPPNEFNLILIISAYTYVPLCVLEELAQCVFPTFTASIPPWVAAYRCKTAAYLLYTTLAVRRFRQTDEAPSNGQTIVQMVAAQLSPQRLSHGAETGSQANDSIQQQGGAGAAHVSASGSNTDGGGGGGSSGSYDEDLGEPVCRICMEGLDAGELFSPCLCRGSMRFVHRECLDRWRHASSNARSVHECVTCEFTYVLRRPLLTNLLRSTLALYFAALCGALIILVVLAHLGKLCACSPSGAGSYPCVHFESAGLSASDLVEALQPFTSAGHAFGQADIDTWAQQVGLSRVVRAAGLTLEELESGLLL
eukprot:COSAG05_NODE_3078_length_2344_cov_1.261470_2_plen_697_part_01